MKIERKSKFYVFLIEILWCVFFLALSCIICTHFFVKGAAIKEEAVAKSNASIIASNLAEDLRLGGSMALYQRLSEGHYQKLVDGYTIDVYTKALNASYFEHSLHISLKGMPLIEYKVVSEVKE